MQEDLEVSSEATLAIGSQVMQKKILHPLQLTNLSCLALFMNRSLFADCHGKYFQVTGNNYGLACSYKPMEENIHYTCIYWMIEDSCHLITGSSNTTSLQMHQQRKDVIVFARIVGIERVAYYNSHLHLINVPQAPLMLATLRGPCFV